MTKQSLLHQAANYCGFDSVNDMIETYICNSTVPGICECGYVETTEPDGYGWCEECQKASCTSVLLLAGVI